MVSDKFELDSGISVDAVTAVDGDNGDNGDDDASGAAADDDVAAMHFPRTLHAPVPTESN